jgi:hypothetical protein
MGGGTSRDGGAKRARRLNDHWPSPIPFVRVAFVLAQPNEHSSGDNSLQKNRRQVKLDPWAIMSSRLQAPDLALQPARRAEKNFSTKIACNLLISLVSDERIQGNPRKYNVQNQGFS